MCHSSEKHFLHKNLLSLLLRGLIMPSDDVYMYLFGFQGDRSVNVHFLSKPRHVTPQINCLRKSSPIMRGSTHIYGVPKEIDGKMFILRVNLGMWPLKSNILEKWALFWGLHFQLWSLCNWLSPWVCPVYNIPSWSVKSTSSVLWSSANFCNISQNINSKAPVALQHFKTKKVVWTWKDDWPPGELLHMKDLLPERVTI